MITLDSIQLPGDLHWSDEIWSPVQQERKQSLTGSLLVEEDSVLAGRPITLEGSETAAWVSRQIVLDLLALAETPGMEMTLTLEDGRTFTVMFNREHGQPVEAEPVVIELPQQAGDEYVLYAIYLMEV